LICSDDEGNPRGIWVTNRAGTKIHQVLNSKFPAWFPTWGGDDRIYFIREDPEGTTPDRIYWIPASGHGKPVRATDGDGYESNPDWGKRGLLYVSSKKVRQPGEMLLRSDGRTIHLMPRHHVDSATWSPDERSVAWLAPFSSSRVNGVWVAKFRSGGGDPYLDDIRQVAFSGEPGVPSWRG